MTENIKSKLWKHIAALIYDIFPILGIFLFTSLLLIVIRGGSEVPAHTLWLQLLLIIEIYLYFTYSWKKGGQTIGMRAWKIGINNYQQLSWGDVTLRFVAGIISCCLLGLGLWWKIWDQQKLSWMDKVCRQSTVEIKTSRQNHQ